MSIYRRQYRDATTGKLRRAARFTAEFTYHGKLYRRSGFVDRDHAKDWLAAESNKLRRGQTGYVKPLLKAEVMPLIVRFADHLRAKGDDDKYAYIAEKRLNRLAGECGWATLGQVNAASLDEWKARDSFCVRRPKLAIGSRTKNQYIRTAQEWGKWLVKPEGKLSANPLADVAPLPAKHNDDYRRAATVEELNAIFSACSPERHLYYSFRIYQASIRSRTLKYLTYRMANLDASPPFLMIPGEYDKSRKPKKYVMRFQIAQEIRGLRKRTKAKADDLIFPDPPTLDDFRADMASAGVKSEFGKNVGRLDYHALRSAIVKLGKDEGLTAFQMMDLMGWKTMQTMLKHYNKNAVDASLGATMEKLPTLGKLRRA